MPPDLSNNILDEATVLMLARGVRVFQGALLAPSEREHVSRLLALMDPPMNSVIADVGCGVGEVARLMTEERSDLDFILINKNALQLDNAPSQFQQILADMHEIPLDDASVDGAMFCYSLCHSDFHFALAEAARITRSGGFLFVYDYERLDGTNALFEDRLSARALSRDMLVVTAQRAGWAPEFWETPECDDTPFRDAYDNDDEYDLIFSDLRVCVWKMVRA